MPYGGLFKVDNLILDMVSVSGLLLLLRPQSLKYGFRKQSDNERNPTPVLFAVDNQLFLLRSLVDISCRFSELCAKQGEQVQSGSHWGTDSVIIVKLKTDLT